MFLSHFVHQLAMRRERIVYLDADLVELERPIPTRLIAQGYRELVEMQQRTLQPLARRQEHGYSGVGGASARIDHLRLKAKRRILGGNALQVARGRMTGFASA